MALPGRNLAGSSDDGRPKTDFYPTPAWATTALIKRQDFVKGLMWEPACGDGAMSKVLEEAGHNVLSTDLNEYGYGESRVDFLTCSRKYRNLSTIVTNPPFKLANQFLKRAKSFNPIHIAMFLKIQFLEGILRYTVFQDEKFPLEKVLVFSNRVTLHRNGIPKKDKHGKINGGTICFAWFIWGKDHQGPATIGWINDRDPNKKGRKKK